MTGHPVHTMRHLPPKLAARRAQVVTLAARLMAQDGIADYALARRKAAEQLDIRDISALPDNSEIEVELRLYQSLYQGTEQRDRIDRLRRSALAVMRETSAFSPDVTPYLSGPVLDGTAGRQARIDILLYTDDAKAVEIGLVNRGIDHSALTDRHLPDACEAAYALEYDGDPVALFVLPRAAERVALRHGQARARIAEVAAMLAAHPADTMNTP